MTSTSTPSRRGTVTKKKSVGKADDPFAPASQRAAASDEAVRDHWGRYLIPRPDENGQPTEKAVAWSRATTIAKSISDTYVLQKWGERMTAKGLAMRPDLRSLVASTPLEDRDKLNAICEDAKAAAGSKVAANLGTAMHGHTEAADKGLVDDAYLAGLEELERADLEAYRKALEEHGIRILADYIERTVILEAGEDIAGTFDRIVIMPDGTLRIADLKTGRDLSYGWNEIAIQLAIYSRAKLIWDWKTQTFLQMPEVDQKLGLVMHLPIGEGECTLYDVDLQEGWDALELCVQVRQWRKKRSLATVRGKARATKAVPVTPLDRVRAATTKAELAALWDELKPQGLWSTAVAAAAQDQLSKFATA